MHGINVVKSAVKTSSKHTLALFCLNNQNKCVK